MAAPQLRAGNATARSDRVGEGWYRDRYEVELGDADVLALFGRLHERASRVIDDAITEFARAMLADAFCVAEVASRTLGGVGEPPLRLPRLWLIEGGQPEQ